MSAWTEPECFSCQYFLVISICVLPEVYPSVLCQICLKGSLDVFLDQPNIFLACVCLFLPIYVVRNLLMSIWTELVCLLANIFLVSSIGVYLKCFPTSVANLSEGITWCLPGSTQCLSCLRLSDGFDQCLSELVLTCFFLPMSVRRNLLMSVWTELTCLLASVCLMSSIGVCPKCFPTSVAYLSEGITWCLPGSTQCLSCLRLSDGFDQCLSELILTCFFLPMSVRRNLLMSVWIELTCLLASVCLNEFNRCLPEVFPTACLSVSF